MIKRILDWLRGKPAPPAWHRYDLDGRLEYQDYLLETNMVEYFGPFASHRIKVHQRHYRCSCGTLLTEGPSGGCAVNAVCEPCKRNYGCLPFFDLK